MYVDKQKLTKLFNETNSEELANHVRAGTLTKDANELALAELSSRGYDLNGSSSGDATGSASSKPGAEKLRRLALGMAAGISILIVAVSYCSDVASRRLNTLLGKPSRLERVDMLSATPEQADSAFRWRSVVPSVPHPVDQGQILVSLIPAAPNEAATIWNVTRDQLTRVDSPAALADGAGKAGRITSLGPFQGGLAPASVEYELATEQAKGESGASAKTTTRWGYVDREGKWAVAPRYFGATQFVGEVAVVAIASEAFRLIDRSGKEQKIESLADNLQILGSMHIRNFPLARLGRWTAIRHEGKVVTLNLGETNEVSGVQTYLNDGTRTIIVPGVEAKPSADGELWLVLTPEGERFWKPSSGFVEVPGDWLPVRPLASNLFLAHSRVNQTSALVTTDGQLIADPAPVVKLLTPTRYIACESSYSPSLHQWEELSRNIGPGLPNHQCGILDDQGQWWARPVHQIVSPWGSDHVHLQSGGHACLADLRQEKAPDCATVSAAAPAVPLLSTGLGRSYAYQNGEKKVLIPFQYRLAYPYIGRLAHVVDEAGFPGLIDQSGRWLTPGPDGDPVSDAHLRAAVAQSPYRHRAPAGTGLMNADGKWSIPPVFKDLAHYADGTVQACRHTLGYIGNCRHLDRSGKALPASAEQPLEEKKAAPAISFAGATPHRPTPEPPAQNSATQAIAVALNGRWGYQDHQGKWIIPPRFDDAEDFTGDTASAAVLSEVDPASEIPAESQPGVVRKIKKTKEKIKELRWGRIDRDGQWITPPTYKSADELSQHEADCTGECAEDSSPQPPAEASPPPTDGGRPKTHLGFTITQAKLPPVPEALQKRWVTVEVRHFEPAGLFAVKAEHPAAADEKAGRFAIADDHGRWLVPVGTWWRSLWAKLSN